MKRLVYAACDSVRFARRDRFLGPECPHPRLGPKVVTRPTPIRKCFAPWASDTKLFQYPAKKGPYRIALANGYIANTWRIQMIKTAKAYAAQPDVAAKLKEFKVVSTGEDVAAQIAAINNFIDSGYDAIVVNAQNPAAFKPVIKRANDAGVVLVAFDNILDTEEAINVNVDQKGLGKYWAEWLVKNVPNGGKVLEVRGVSGTSVDRDRHDGIQEVFKASGKKWDTVEVIGKWDDPDRAEGDRRRDRRAQEVRRDHRAGRRHRRRAGDDRRQASVRALRRRDRERLPQVLRQVRRRRASSARRRAPGRPRWRSRSRRRSRRSKARSCRSRSSCRWRRPSIPNMKEGTDFYSGAERQLLRRQLVSRPAASTSPRRKSWARPRPTSSYRRGARMMPARRRARERPASQR